MRIAARIAGLVVLWLLAWGSVTVGNVVSGVLAAAVLLAVFPPGPPGHVRVDLLGAARLAGYVAVQLVTSNVVIAKQIVRRDPDVAPGVLAHRLRAPSAEVLTAMTSVLALSPGTMTVDTDAECSVIHVHFLFLRDVAAARASLAHLEDLVRGALSPRPQAIDPATPKELT